MQITLPAIEPTAIRLPASTGELNRLKNTLNGQPETGLACSVGWSIGPRRL